MCQHRLKRPYFLTVPQSYFAQLRHLIIRWGEKRRIEGNYPAHIVLESGLSRMGTGIAQSVARLASSYVHFSAMQVRIPLTTLSKIEEKKNTFQLFLQSVVSIFGLSPSGCGGFTGYFSAKSRKLLWISHTTRQSAS